MNHAANRLLSDNYVSVLLTATSQTRFSVSKKRSDALDQRRYFGGNISASSVYSSGYGESQGSVSISGRREDGKRN